MLKTCPSTSWQFKAAFDIFVWKSCAGCSARLRIGQNIRETWQARCAARSPGRMGSCSSTETREIFTTSTPTLKFGPSSLSHRGGSMRVRSKAPSAFLLGCRATRAARGNTGKAWAATATAAWWGRVLEDAQRPAMVENSHRSLWPDPTRSALPKGSSATATEEGQPPSSPRCPSVLEGSKRWAVRHSTARSRRRTGVLLCLASPLQSHSGRAQEFSVKWEDILLPLFI